MIGGGGSILAVPLLLYVVGVSDPHVAIGTSALAVAVNALANLVPHARKGHVRWRVALLFALVGVAGATLGSSLGKSLDGNKLLALFALLMIVIAVLMQRGGRAAPAEPRPSGRAAAAKVAGTGFAVGALSGFFGIGGGFLIVPGPDLRHRHPHHRRHRLVAGRGGRLRPHHGAQLCGLGTRRLDDRARVYRRRHCRRLGRGASRRASPARAHDAPPRLRRSPGDRRALHARAQPRGVRLRPSPPRPVRGFDRGFDIDIFTKMHIFGAGGGRRRREVRMKALRNLFISQGKSGEPPLCEVDAETVRGWQKQGGCVLIDVREDVEYRVERIPGACLAPLSRLEEALPSLPAAGLRPCTSVAAAPAPGRRRVAWHAAAPAKPTFSAGGIAAWNARGFPVERS